MKYFFYLFVFIVTLNYNSLLTIASTNNKTRSNIRDSVNTTINDFDKTVSKFERKVVMKQIPTCIVVAKDKYNILKSSIIHLGNIRISNKVTFSILKKEDLWGLLRRPHGRGRIVIYKDNILYGYYSGFQYGFNARVKGCKLYIKDIVVDSLGYTSLGDCNIIDLSKGIPKHVTISSDRECSEVHTFINAIK